ncbi:MAG TPA: hypothetical protein V6C89_20340 [Drouetiella sp.]|jgi:hypothetical protein
MKKVFVSCQAIDEKEAQDFLHGLIKAGFEVQHSPDPPSHGNDPAWEGWYEKRLSETVARADYFVVVVDRGWDSSTWMGIEGEAALSEVRKKRPLRMFSYILSNREVTNPMRKYLGQALPRGSHDAVSFLKNYKNDSI